LNRAAQVPNLFVDAAELKTIKPAEA
jgi:hypothetical protein